MYTLPQNMSSLQFNGKFDIFAPKAFWQIERRRKEGGEGRLSSAANLGQVNKKDRHLSYYASGGAFSAFYVTYFQQRATIKICQQFRIFILSSISAADVHPPREKLRLIV